MSIAKNQSLDQKKRAFPSELPNRAQALKHCVPQSREFRMARCRLFSTCRVRIDRTSLVSPLLWNAINYPSFYSAIEMFKILESYTMLLQNADYINEKR